MYNLTDTVIILCSVPNVFSQNNMYLKTALLCSFFPYLKQKTKNSYLIKTYLYSSDSITIHKIKTQNSLKKGYIHTKKVVHIKFNFKFNFIALYQIPITEF